MARFVQMLVKSGVYADENFMVVPTGGFNLVYLRDAKDFRITHDARLQVNEVGFDDVERIASDYFKARAGGLDSVSRLLGLRTAMYSGVHKTAKGKLLQVRANGSGIPQLVAKLGTTAVKLDAAIMPRKEHTVAFKFVRHTTATGTVTPLTVHTPVMAQAWIDKLNWIFGAQANVHFKLLDANWITLSTTANQPMTFEEFERSLVAHKHPGAALTCFLVGKYKGAANGSEAAGTYSVPNKVCVLDDGPSYGIFHDLNYDSFIGVMAHEFTHFAGGAHHNRGLSLMSTGTESLDFDKQLVVQLNAW